MNDIIKPSLCFALLCLLLFKVDVYWEKKKKKNLFYINIYIYLYSYSYTRRRGETKYIFKFNQDMEEMLLIFHYYYYYYYTSFCYDMMRNCNLNVMLAVCFCELRWLLGYVKFPRTEGREGNAYSIVEVDYYVFLRERPTYLVVKTILIIIISFEF